MTQSTLTEALNWRYAVKKMDPAKTVPEEKLANILEAIQYAPTSSGLQPFEVFVVTNPEVKAKLRAAGMNQPQLEEASHVLVFAAWDNYSAERIDDVVALHTEARGGMTEDGKAYYEMLKSMYLPRDEQVNADHAARQAYIAMGFGLVAASMEKVDATPMEGFIPDQVDEILGLRDKGLHAAAIVALGYRAEEGDWLQPLKKVRKPQETLFTKVA
ncbi:NAD(P)H-dependent oxidoreductase [Poseidonocella sedimentorum]|uniref:Nitroreductase n=1 Tax=Poseidonocella sedimentorum TaxID=871652 RepID=A0A1I6DPR4_9RHOB|nr:NAD(P)H-dependent oxidoreductase [Poseidonocella sedimentorum]SFR07434.1 Nitroreductase [Poseidonocella sedimentorum]